MTAHTKQTLFLDLFILPIVNIMLPIIILTVLLVCYLVYNLVSTYGEIKYAKSTIDGKYYTIRRGNNKSAEFLQDSANTLATINQRIMALIAHLELNYSNDMTKNYFIRKLRANYNSYMISEAAVDTRFTTYTVDKKDMHICIRTRDEYENIYDINTLMFVMIHELSHLCNYTPDGTAVQGHGDSFKHIFKFLLQEAIKLGIYEYVNYAQHPQPYCGISINTSIL